MISVKILNANNSLKWNLEFRRILQKIAESHTSPSFCFLFDIFWIGLTFCFWTFVNDFFYRSREIFSMSRSSFFLAIVYLSRFISFCFSAFVLWLALYFFILFFLFNFLRRPKEPFALINPVSTITAKWPDIFGACIPTPSHLGHWVRRKGWISEFDYSLARSGQF